MIVVSLLILLILILRIIVGNLNASPTNTRKVESIFCGIAYLCIVMLAMFRGEDVGVDTLGYIKDYQGIYTMEYSDIIDEYKGYEAYYLINKMFSMIGLPYFIWFGFIEFLLVWALSRYINKFSKDRLYSIILFITTGLFMFSLAGLKQTLGLAIMLHAFIDFTNNKYFRSATLVVLAYFTHPVSLLSLFPFIIYALRNKNVLLPLVLVISLCVCVGGLYTTSLMVSILGNDHYEMYLDVNDSYTKSTLYLYCLFLICTLPWIIKNFRKYNIPKFELSCVILACVFQYLASYSPSLFRLAYAFLPFLFVYLPNSFSISIRKTTESALMKYCVLAGAIIFCLYSNRNMVFTFMN